MPVWHAATEELRQQGKVGMVGIVQEQHPDRARLFMQWKQMDWPVLVDPLNLLDVGVVPIVLLIDEHGVIRGKPRGGDPSKIVREFAVASFDAPPGETGDLGSPQRLAVSGTEALVLWGSDEDLDRAISAYEQAIEADPEDARAEFRLGVAYRMRYDSDRGEASDFRSAVEHWSRGREIQPNNYIWMRRLQQFGPRQQKPYPFYDWVATARTEIEARGETPVALPVEPRGAELASPARFDSSGESAIEPDPDGRIQRDPGEFVRVEVTTVPQRIDPSGTARVHLEYRLDPRRKAHWNNEVGGLVAWLDPPAGWQVDRRRVEVAPPPRAVSEEIRRVEFEVQGPDSASEPIELTGYTLYYICEGAQGQCLYRRQDLSIELVPTN